MRFRICIRYVLPCEVSYLETSLILESTVLITSIQPGVKSRLTRALYLTVGLAQCGADPWVHPFPILEARLQYVVDLGTIFIPRLKSPRVLRIAWRTS